AIANAAATVSANSPNDSAYIGLAILVPLEFEEVKADRDEDSKQAAGDIEADSKKASEAVEAAETAKQAMDEAHHNGWLADCGNSILSEDKGYCMYERALKLAGITYPTACPEAGWTFGMALERARSYYAYRMTNDQPLNQTTKELAKCEVRKQYYAYAYELLLSAYVFDDGLGTVRLYFPTLPNSLNDFKNCRLYTDQVYPCDNKSIIHGTTKCGEYQANGARGFGSIAQLDNGSLVKCDECQMDLSTTGHIFDMTTRTDTGFEHWYREMALAAQEYEKHAKDYKEKMDEVLGNAKQATDRYQEAFDSLKVTRLNPHPPGRKGCIVIVVDPSAHELPFNLETPLIAEQGPLPMRMAISASALAKDAESNILGDFFNNLSEKANASSPVAGAFVFGADIVFEVWGTILEFYGKGTEGLIKGIGNLIRFTSFDLSSPIAEWAEDTIKSFLEFCGLQPVDLRAPKPLLVNSLYVANADPDSILGQVIVGVKTHYGNLSGNGSGTLPDMIIDSVTTDFESYFNDAVNDGIELFRFSIGPDYFNIEVPIKVCIPEVVVEPLVEQVNSGLSKLQEYLHGEDYKDVWK
ncbi:MAG: hypothetical protein LBU61_00075, partial [Coriobacteriales bacterium]|nr:hypothetical protein [Coriobacteriales bacterium]